jgi:hypothetical protein
VSEALRRPLVWDSLWKVVRNVGGVDHTPDEFVQALSEAPDNQRHPSCLAPRPLPTQHALEALCEEWSSQPHVCIACIRDVKESTCVMRVHMRRCKCPQLHGRPVREGSRWGVAASHR